MPGVEKVLTIEINLRRPPLSPSFLPLFIKFAHNLTRPNEISLTAVVASFLLDPLILYRYMARRRLTAAHSPVHPYNPYKTRPIPLPTRTTFPVLYLYLLMDLPTTATTYDPLSLSQLHFPHLYCCVPGQTCLAVSLALSLLLLKAFLLFL